MELALFPASPRPAILYASEQAVTGILSGGGKRERTLAAASSGAIVSTPSSAASISSSASALDASLRGRRRNASWTQRCPRSEGRRRDPPQRPGCAVSPAKADGGVALSTPLTRELRHAVEARLAHVEKAKAEGERVIALITKHADYLISNPDLIPTSDLIQENRKL